MFCYDLDETLRSLMALQITICPACKSSFNLNASGLTSIDGRVRCGACLAVFKARDHLKETEAHSETSPDRSVFMSEEPLDYFSPFDFLNTKNLQLNNKDQGSKSKK